MKIIYSKKKLIEVNVGESDDEEGDGEKGGGEGGDDEKGDDEESRDDSQEFLDGIENKI